MLSTKSFNTNLAILMLSFSLFSVAGAGMEARRSESSEERSLKRPVVLKTDQEMWEYGTALWNLCQKGRYEEALAFAVPEPTITVNPMTAGDLEGYHFYYFVSLATINMNSGIQLALTDKQRAKLAFQKTLDFLGEYMNKWEKYQSKFSILNERMQFNRAVISHKKSKANSGIGRLMITQAMSDLEKEEAKKLLISAIEDQKKYIMYIETAKDLKDKEVTIFKGKKDLFAEYCTLIPLYNFNHPQRVSFLKQAREVHNFFERNRRFNLQADPFFQETEEGLVMLEQLEQLEQPASFNKEGGKKGRIAALKKEKQKNLYLAFAQSARKVAKGEDDLDFQSYILLQHAEFKALTAVDLRSPQIAPLLKGIEEKIRNQLVKLNQPSTLQDVYRTYASTVTKDALVKDMPSGLASFLLVGDVEAALERVNILFDLEREQRQNNSYLMRYLRAAIKSMNGDYEEWLALEAEATQFQDKMKEKKKRQKQKQRERQVEAAKQSQEEFQRQQESYTARVDINQSLPPLQPAAPVRDKNAELDIPMPVSSLSHQEAKQAKIARHEEAQKRREEEQEKSSSSPSHSSSKPGYSSLKPETGKEEAEAKPLPAIGLTSSLTGVPKDVEEEIQSGSWRFSREKAMAYFEALGCTAKEGGKHKKVELPQAIMVYHDGKLLTIINELGGALTLPRWDGRAGDGTVPHYLRKQILNVRKKIAGLISAQ